MECGRVFLFVVSSNLFRFADSLFDAALHKPCTQTSTLSHNYPRVAGLAVDGVIDYWPTCTHTAYGAPHPWWQVDLQGMYSVHSVLLRNRDIHGERLSDFTIKVSRDGASQGEVCTFHAGAIAAKTAKLMPCDILISGRFVRISKETADLTLCEVQVLVMDRLKLTFQQQVDKVIDGDFESELSAAKAPSCAEHCQKSPSCLAFGYNKDATTCKLYSSTQTSEGNNDGWIFYITVA